MFIILYKREEYNIIMDNELLHKNYNFFYSHFYLLIRTTKLKRAYSFSQELLALKIINDCLKFYINFSLLQSLELETTRQFYFVFHIFIIGVVLIYLIFYDKIILYFDISYLRLYTNSLILLNLIHHCHKKISLQFLYQQMMLWLS